MKTSDQAGLPGIRALIRDDAFACSHQTLGQYRTALLQAIDRGLAQQDKATCKPDLQLAAVQEPATRPAQRTKQGADRLLPALLCAASHLLEAVDGALPQAPHCGEFDRLADAAADLTAALAEAQASMAAGQLAEPVQTPRDTTRLTSDRVAVVDEAVEWRPISYCPPRRKVLLLTDGGVAVLGTWDGVSTWAIAWAPLPVIPAWLRQRLAPVAVRAEQDVTLGVYRHEL